MMDPYDDANFDAVESDEIVEKVLVTYHTAAYESWIGPRWSSLWLGVNILSFVMYEF